MPELLFGPAGAVLAALVTGGLGYLVGLRRIKAQTRSENRKQWMNRLIELLTDFLVTCEHRPEEREKLTRLTTELELLLNPEDEVSKDGAVLEAQRRLLDCIQQIRRNGMTEERPGLPEFLNRSLEHEPGATRRDFIIHQAQVILAKEWALVMKQK